MSFRPPSDGIRLSRRGWRAETRRERRAGRKREDVVIGSWENVKRTHPSGRQQPTPYPIRNLQKPPTIIYRIPTLLTYMGHVSAPGAYLRGVIPTIITVSLIMAFAETAAP